MSSGVSLRGGRSLGCERGANFMLFLVLKVDFVSVKHSQSPTLGRPRVSTRRAHGDLSWCSVLGVLIPSGFSCSLLDLVEGFL